MDLELAPGRYPLPLSDRWILVALAPVPGVIVLKLFLDEALVEIVDDPLDVLGYLRALAAPWASSFAGASSRAQPQPPPPATVA